MRAARDEHQFFTHTWTLLACDKLEGPTTRPAVTENGLCRLKLTSFASFMGPLRWLRNLVWRAEGLKDGYITAAGRRNTHAAISTAATAFLGNLG